MRKVRAIVLFSGGLDSILAVKLLQSQGIETEGVCFSSNFYNDLKARQSAQELGITLNTVDISEDMVDLIKNPPSGYGKNLNPCLDCHSLMIRKTSAIMKEGNFDFIATGEVLGQRPFSQTKEALNRVSELAGTPVLRPLSARLLPETAMENSGLVHRSRLLDISGRSRDRQFELAKKFGIKNYPLPAGGCLLTDPDFCTRLMKMLDDWPDCQADDIEILKYGRPYWFSVIDGGRKILAVIGRKHEDNLSLVKNAKADDLLIEMIDVVGPTVLIRHKDDNRGIKTGELELDIPDNLKMSEIGLVEEKNTDDIIATVCLLTGWYSAKARGKKVKFKIRNIR